MKTMLRRIMDSFSAVAGNRFFSQLGEDMLLATYFRSKRKNSRIDEFIGRVRLHPGYYIDVGGYSPKRLSNSYWFYKRGWSGVTVEPNPEAKIWFRLLRPRDMHVCAAITDIESKVYYYSNGYSGVNFISNEVLTKEGVNRTEISGLSLKSLIEKFVPMNQKIDFMSIDCEGHDLNVLKSNDWNKYRPEIVVAETSEDSDVTKFMEANMYKVVAMTFGSVLYKDSMSVESFQTE